MNDEVYVWHAEKRQSFLQADIIFLVFPPPGIPKTPKIGNLHTFAISLEKHEDELAFWPADKYESFLQGASIILVVCKQDCTKYPE